MLEQVLRRIAEPVAGQDGADYTAVVCGRQRGDGRWEAWLEFAPRGSGPVLRSVRETTQPDLLLLQHWADLLSRIYVQGALERTLNLQKPRRFAGTAAPRVGHPHFEGPSPEPGSKDPPAPDDVAVNPITAYRQGPEHLRERLMALSTYELRLIVRAYRFDRDLGLTVESLSAPALVRLIIDGTRARLE